MNYYKLFERINTFIFDVDGVLTDCNIIVDEEGNLIRKMSVRDGYALKRAILHDYRVCIITGGNSSGVRKRLEDLGVSDYFAGIYDKVQVYKELVQKYHLQAEEVLYMGDDLLDMAVMKKVGLPTCPANAVNNLKEISKYISPFKGGEGCVRDVIEKTMKVQGKWMES